MDKGITLTLVNWILAFLPILVLLFTILFFKWGAPKSGAVSWFVAMLLGMFVFGADSRLLAFANSKGLEPGALCALNYLGCGILYNLVERSAPLKSSARR